MIVQLRWKNTSTGKEYSDRRKLPLTFGRELHTQIVLSAPDISRQHAELFVQGGRLFVRDLNSTHGTLLNGEPCMEASVQYGDILSIGCFEIYIEFPDEETRPEPGQERRDEGQMSTMYSGKKQLNAKHRKSADNSFEAEGDMETNYGSEPT